MVEAVLGMRWAEPPAPEDGAEGEPEGGAPQGGNADKVAEYYLKRGAPGCSQTRPAGLVAAPPTGLQPCPQVGALRPHPLRVGGGASGRVVRCAQAEELPGEARARRPPSPRACVGDALFSTKLRLRPLSRCPSLTRGRPPARPRPQAD